MRPIITVLLLFAVAGCTRPEGERVHLLYSFLGSVEQMKTERAIVRAFEAENPGSVIDLLPIGARRAGELELGHSVLDIGHCLSSEAGLTGKGRG